MKYLIIYFFFRRYQTVHDRDPIGVQEIIQNISTSTHDDPVSIIAPFNLLLDEDEYQIHATKDLEIIN